MRGLVSLSALFLAGLCLPTFLLAAGFVGNVTDASGALVVGATVKVRNLDTQREETVLTNGAGAYHFPTLVEGRYDLTFTKDGFRPQTAQSLVLRVGEELRLDATLNPGNQETNLAIIASPVPLATETATLATVVDSRNIQELPLNGRQLQNLALLAPGIAAGWNWSTAANRYGKARENTEGAFNVNGLRGRSNNFVLDGAPMNVQQYGVINFEPSNETVREFSLVSSTPEAEYGGTMGATVNIVTRSGTSQFHGALYEFFRNDVLDANSTFAKAAGLERGKLRQNQYGGNLGGPLFSKRHFFFGNFEQLRIVEGVETRLVSVPTAQERQGLLRYRDAAGATQTLNLANRLNPISRRLLDFYPAPNTGGDNALNYASALTIGLTDTQYHIRTDHYLTDRDQVMVRFSRNNNDQQYIINRFGGPFIPGFSLLNPEKTAHAVASHLHTFSSAMVNEFRGGLNRYANDLGNGDPSSAEAFGLPNGNGSANGIPSLTFAGNAIEPLGGLTWLNRIQNETTTNFSDTLSLLTASHHFKFGGSLSRRHFNSRGASNQRGTISFDGSRNGLVPRLPGNERAGALADFLLGQPFEASIVVGAFGRGYRQTATAFFVQDSWRATPRLTVNLGLRYDYSAPWTEVNGKLSNLTPDGTLALVGSGTLDRLYQPDRNNFAPRLGLAYDLRGNSQTVLRAGLAYTYETLLQANSVQQVENNPPFSSFAVTRSPSPFPATGNATTLLDLRNQAQPSNSIAAIDPRAFRNPYAVQWNFSLQQRLANVWLLELAYVGTRGQALPYFFNANQVPLASLSSAQRNTIASAIAAGQDTTPLLAPLRPYPAFDAVTLSRNTAQSTYHSGQIKIERRFSRGLSVLASHTWAKSIDNASDFGSGDPSERILNSSNLALQRGPSSFDVQHRFTSAFTWELPRGRGWLLDGWQMNGIVTLQSGQPFTPFTSNFDPFRNEAFNRPDVVGDPQANIPADLAFNPAAFRNPAPGTFGNAGRNIVRGDGFQSFDLSAFKNFAFTESLRLQFRAEAVNAFNTVNFQGPVVNINTTPGRWVATAQPRVVQLGLKLSF